MLSKYKQSSYDDLYATTFPKFFKKYLGFTNFHIYKYIIIINKYNNRSDDSVR